VRHAVERTLDTLIIGAGPAGLAVGACLKARGSPLVLVDQAPTVGSSWHGHYDRLHLHTDKRHSALPYLGFPSATPRYPSRE
jgi:cation diffusion facilitator CzcD-associated flavoprotein CzcO